MKTSLPLHLTAGAVALLGVLSAFTAAASAPTPPGPCAVVPDGLTLIVNDGEGVGTATSSSYEQILDAAGAPTVAAVRGPDGTVWVQRGGDQPAILRVGPGGSPAEAYAADELDLGTAGWLGDRSAAVFLDTTGIPEPTTEGIGAVVVDFADATQVTVSPSVWWEAGVSSAAIGADRVVEGGGELVEDWFRSFGPNGEEYPDWISPDNADLPPSYMAPAPAVSPDGTRAELSYLEFGGQDPQGWTDRFALVVADAVTGEESLRIDIGEEGNWPMNVDFDGRFWVGTFGAMADGDPAAVVAQRVVVVDTEAVSPVAIDAGCTAGTTATIDKAGSPQPNLPSPTPIPPTTTPPTTATPPAPTIVPGRCGDYTVVDNAYPVKRCEQGVTVAVVQIMLVHRGAAIEVDGFFGPATEAAVREFQASAGLEVDGLVGPDTWSSLYDPARLAGDDTDGDGTVEPWEVPLDPGGGEPGGGGGGWIGSVHPFPRFDTSSEGGHAGTAEIAGVPVWATWSVDGSDAAAPYDHGLFLITGGDSRTLLLARTDTDPASDPAATLTVLDAVHFTVTPDARLLDIDCSYDGAADPSIVAITSSPSGSPMSVTVAAAWRLSSGSGQIEPLDAAHVACSMNGLIVD